MPDPILVGTARRWKSFLCLLVIALSAAPRVSAAARFKVDSDKDAVDATPDDGRCASTLPLGECTLRAAIQQANASIGADSIIVPRGTYKLELAAVLGP